MNAQKYKEIFLGSIYKKDYEKEGQNGSVYPVNRVELNAYFYSGTYQDIDKNEVPYNGIKLKLINSKLQNMNGEVSIKHKVVNGKSYPDSTSVVLKFDELSDIMTDLDGELKSMYDTLVEDNSEIIKLNYLTDDKNIKVDELSIEDLPF